MRSFGIARSFICLACLATVCPGAWAVGETYVAKPVLPQEVSAALNSRPEADDRVAISRIVSQETTIWDAQGVICGDVVFEETFESGLNFERWKLSSSQGVEISDDGHGGKCAKVSPLSGVFNGLSLASNAYVRIDPTHQYALLIDVRTPERGYPLFVRLDYFDANLADLNCPCQFQGSVDATQPTIFHHNSYVISPGCPVAARYVKISIFLSPNYDRPGMVDNIRVADLTMAVKSHLSRRESVLASRAAAGKQDVLVYCAGDLSASYPILPDSADVPGRAGDVLRVCEFPGEKTRATVILWSRSDWKDVTVSFSDLVGGVGAIPSSSVSARVLKVHYQGVTAPGGLGLQNGKMTLVPELLLNDDALVIVDCDNERNLVKYTTADGPRYVDINTVWSNDWADRIPADVMPIRDAKALQPFSMRGGLNKQLVLTLDVPDDAKPGLYRGRVEFSSGGRRIAVLPVELVVHPVRLPKAAETIYSPDREYTMGLYVWGELDGRDRRLICPLYRSREQLLNEYRTLVDYSILDPIFIWTPETVFDDAAFRRHLEVVREAGFRTKKLHLGGSGHMGNATAAADLAAMKDRLRRAMGVARAYGFEEVYFYGFDEARGESLLSQRAAWSAARETGAKTMVSGYAEHFAKVGGFLDLIVYADSVGTVVPDEWHKVGSRIWKYNSPQTFCEDPVVMRRNYGLSLWCLGYDGASTYCNFGSSTCWNDVCGYLRSKNGGGDGSLAGRQLVIEYPTMDGVIPTVALAGLESAIKDVRVMTLLRRLQRKTGDGEVAAWLERTDFAFCDLSEARRQAVRLILKMLGR